MGEPGTAASTEPGGLEEVAVALDGDSDCVTLRKPDEVYREIYGAARRKARQMRKAAVAALMEAEQIRSKYMLEEMEDSDESDADPDADESALE